MDVVKTEYKNKEILTTKGTKNTKKILKVLPFVKIQRIKNNGIW